jgi:hypothetical protein
MKGNPLFMALFLWLAFGSLTFSQDTPTEPPLEPVLLSLYSLPSHGGFRSKLPGQDSWFGHLWVDHRKIGLIVPGKFVTLKIPEGEHIIAGERGVNGARFGPAPESSIQTAVSLHRGTRYFMRLTVDSRQVAGFGPLHYLAEPVTCREAYSEAVALEPVKLKHIEKPILEQVVRESYFPECGK